jgi:phage tail-like protein
VTAGFGELLYRSLPGLYRDKDVDGELRRFLEIAAQPLAELSASIGQLSQDTVIATCQNVLIPLIGGLVGADVDSSLPARAQRAQVQEAVGFYRGKGVREPLLAFAERLTGWRVELVDFSQRVARLPVLADLNPVLLRRDQPVGEQQPGSGNFFFRVDQTERPIFDAVQGRPITRQALAGDVAAYAGVEGRFTVKERGADLFGGDSPFLAVSADLTDFDDPRTPAGAPLVIGSNQVAVDPELGRFRIADPVPQAGSLEVTFHELLPGSVQPQSFAIGDSAVMVRLGRSDDPAPTTLDLRAPRRVTDRTGRAHYDNHGFFCTPAVVAADRRPSPLPPEDRSGRFSFDDRPLAPADADGVPLQLLDGIDGRPLTRGRLRGHEQELCGTPRGFSIRVRGVDVLDPAFRPPLRVRAADLSDLDTPVDTDGTPMTLDPTDVAVDPQLGRFRLDLPALAASPEQVRVDYLLAPATAVDDAKPSGLSDAIPEVMSLSANGGLLRLVDRLDGTPISMAVRLGRPVDRYDGTARGWVIRRNGADVRADLAAQLGDLGDPTSAVPAGRLTVDPDRGRLKFPAGFLAPGDRITVSFSFEDPDEEAQRFDSLAQRLPRVLPAGVVAVLTDTRPRPVDPATLA